MVEVSVIIPAKNTARWITEQLESLNRQINAPSFEVIVADNGSSDGTIQAVHDYARLASYPLSCIDASGPPSASYARNMGAKAAQGDILLFCDSDDYVNDIWICSLVEAYRASGGALVSGALHHEKFNSADILYAYNIQRDPEPSEKIYDAHPTQYAGFLPTVPGGNFAISASDYADLRGMDYSFPGGAEETDFSWRAILSGKNVVSAPRAIIQYRLKTDKKSLFRQQRIQQRAKVLLWVRYRNHGMPGPSLKYSIQEICTNTLKILKAKNNSKEQLRSVRLLGGHLGAVEGIIKYRIFRVRNSPKF